MAMKIYNKGEQVNVVRGALKGISGIVDEMDNETGEVTITNGDGIYVKVSNGCLARPSKPQDLMPILEKTEDEPEPEVVAVEVREEVAPTQIAKPVAKKTGETKAQLCACGCGELTNPDKVREFVMGHDQRHKGNLIRAMQAGSEEAEAEIRRRQWRTEAEIMALKKKARDAAERKEARERAAAEKEAEKVAIEA